ncbi:MAG: hypothetical protein IKE43_05430 [Coriobacteriales bacterium]|nr:hypothetical protein [Coriobacteriales bacterium]
MLFFLTGEIQTGKTRWLEQLVKLLAEKGVLCEGVIAPGVWREIPIEAEKTEVGVQASVSIPAGTRTCRYEKLGIDNVLLPGGERIAFAKRSDLASESERKSASQSRGAQLAWLSLIPR